MCGWVTRWRNTHGYGVQSPTDYRFLKYVIRERGEYYAYANLRAHAGMTGEELKKGLLFFRIANALQSDVLYDSTERAAKYAPFFSAGCVRMEVRCNGAKEGCAIPMMTDGDEARGKRLLLRLSCRDYSCEEMAKLLNSLPYNAAVIAEDIDCDSDARESYRALLGSEKARITYDMQTFALCFLLPNRFKQTYFIYF